METVKTLAKIAIGKLNEYGNPIKTSVHMNISEDYKIMVMMIDSKMAELKLLLQTVDPMTKKQHEIASEVGDEIVELLNGELKTLCKEIRDKVPDDQPQILDTLKKEHKELFETRVPEMQRIVRLLRA